jgi:archaemetzincin
MRLRFGRPLIILLALWAFREEPCAQGESPDSEIMVPSPFAKLLPLHEKLGPPQPGDWLAEHAEPGQTYRQYLRSRPVKPDNRRRVIYIEPLGPFTTTQERIIKLSAEYMGLYFGLPVKVGKGLSLDVIPAEARRKHPEWGMDQILSTYVLEEVLYPRLPSDAVAYIAFTATDLWPGEGWNFVFGQASLTHRVGVWSIYRKGDPHESDASYRRCLRRTLKTATHETGHMFSLPHCTYFECNMCGSNHLAESDRHPLWLCPVCLAKLCWATKVDPAKRFERLAAFCDAHGLTTEQAFFEKSLGVLRGEQP